MDPAEVAALADKYSSLLRLIAAPVGALRDRGLRELAARWPGVLREGQLAAVDRLAARERALMSLGAASRAVFRAEGFAAVPLWAELHRLLGDLAWLRSARPDPTTLPAGLDPARSERWPGDPSWWAGLAWPPGAGLPRSWLAAVSGQSPAELDRALRA